MMSQLLTLLLAQAEGEISEGQIAAITGMDRVSIRQARLDELASAQRIWKKWREANPPVLVARLEAESGEQWREDVGDPGVHDKDPADLNSEIPE